MTKEELEEALVLLNSTYKKLEEELIGAREKNREMIHLMNEQKETEEKLAYLAYHDSLTGLPNRRLLIDRLDMAFAHAKRHQMTMALMFLDLDRFKMINDMLGHDVGDKVLVEVSARIKKSLREEDTVARLGGDEFVLLLPHIEQPEGIGKVAERICRILSQPIVVGTGEFHVTASIGIALFPQDGKDIDSLLKSADTALYKAKELGRNTHQFYSPYKGDAA